MHAPITNTTSVPVSIADLWPVERVAVELGVGVGTVRRHIAAGDLPVARVLGRLVAHRADVERLRVQRERRFGRRCRRHDGPAGGAR